MDNLNILIAGIDHIKKMRAVEDEVSKSFKMLNNDFNFFSFGFFEEKYIKLLQYAVDDLHDWIPYFVYDCNLGKTPLTVVFKNGEKIQLKTVKQLYKVINQE